MPLDRLACRLFGVVWALRDDDGGNKEVRRVCEPHTGRETELRIFADSCRGLRLCATLRRCAENFPALVLPPHVGLVKVANNQAGNLARELCPCGCAALQLCVLRLELLPA